MLPQAPAVLAQVEGVEGGPLAVPVLGQPALEEVTITPPRRSDLTEWDQVAAPTVSMTASTRNGRRLPGSSAATAPAARACSRLAAVRLVATTSRPPAAPRAIAPEATPPPAPWTRTRSPGRSAAVVKSIR